MTAKSTAYVDIRLPLGKVSRFGLDRAIWPWLEERAGYKSCERNPRGRWNVFVIPTSRGHLCRFYFADHNIAMLFKLSWA